MSPRRPGPALRAALLLVLLATSALAEDGTPPAGHAAEQAALQKLVDQIRPEVATLRGLEWKHEVPVRVLSREELRAWMQQGLERDVTPEEWVRDTRLVRRLGLLREGENLRDLAQLMLQEMVAGAYDPKTKELFLTAGFEGQGNIPTLVHELVHALEDQHFDLMKLEEPYREDDPDRAFAIRCLFEGSAEWARRRFQDLRPDAARAYYEQMGKNTEMQAGQMRVMRAVPTHMLLSTLLHYRVGPNFVTHAVGDDYVEGMRKLLADPPLTQEHILHPHKWLGSARDLPRTVLWGPDVVGALGAGWKRMHEHTVGELDLAVYLDYFLGDEEGRLNLRTMGLGMFVDAMSNRAARGWDAGRVLYAENAEGAIAVVQAFAFDSAEDADEAARVLGAALRKAHGEAWKGEGWLDDAALGGKRFDYTGGHGRGRILHRGREVLVLDGIGREAFDRAWAADQQTSFRKAEGDCGDEMADPFEGYAVVDTQRGLGLMLPGTGWEAERGGRMPAVFATAAKDAVKVSFVVLDQETTQAGLPRIGSMILGRLFDGAQVQPTQLMGLPGIRHALPARPGQRGTMHVASDAARTYVALVTGPAAALEEARGDVARLLQGMPGPTWRPAPPNAEGPPAPRPAGLRSIPGY